MACAIASRSGCRATASVGDAGGSEERRCGDTGGTARWTAGKGAGARGGGGTDGGRGVSSLERVAAGAEAAAAEPAAAGGGCNPDTVRVRGGGAMRRGAAGGR